MPQLWTFAHDRDIGMLSVDQSIANIARVFNVISATVRRLRCCFQLTGNGNVVP